MMGVFKFKHRAAFDDRVRKRKPHAIRRKQQPSAVPARTRDVAFRIKDVIELCYNHVFDFTSLAHRTVHPTVRQDALPVDVSYALAGKEHASLSDFLKRGCALRRDGFSRKL